MNSSAITDVFCNHSVVMILSIVMMARMNKIVRNREMTLTSKLIHQKQQPKYTQQHPIHLYEISFDEYQMLGI